MICYIVIMTECDWETTSRNLPAICSEDKGNGLSSPFMSEKKEEAQKLIDKLRGTFKDCEYVIGEVKIPPSLPARPVSRKYFSSKEMK